MNRLMIEDCQLAIAANRVSARVSTAVRGWPVAAQINRQSSITDLQFR
jgi:hypothetical protein